MAKFERTLLTKNLNNETISTPPQSIEQDKVHFIISTTADGRRKFKTNLLPLITVILMVLLFVSVYVLYTLVNENENKHENGEEKNNNILLSRYSFPGCGLRKCKDKGACQPRIRRLVSGKISSSNDWPWMVDVLVDRRHTCGGVLLNTRYILTAAHCLYINEHPLDISRLTVVVGSFNRILPEFSRQEHTACSSSVHESFNAFTMENDIALVQLKQNVQLNDHVWPVCIPADEMSLFVGFGYMLGWGKSKPSSSLSLSLQSVFVPIVSYTKCSKSNSPIYREVNVDKITNLCVGYGKSNPEYACYGDSGGPFMQEIDHIWYSTGLISWIDPTCNSTIRDAYTVLTKISNFEEWIGDHMDVSYFNDGQI